MLSIVLFTIVFSSLCWLTTPATTAPVEQSTDEVLGEYLHDVLAIETEQELDTFIAERFEYVKTPATQETDAQWTSFMNKVIAPQAVAVVPVDYTIRELKGMASTAHIKGYGRMNKAQLREALGI